MFTMAIGGVSSALKPDLNLAELIVLTLKQYSDSIPVDYLARVLNQHPSVVGEYVDLLEQKNVVKRDGGKVGLVSDK